MGLHTVKSGENLSSIAKHFKLNSWQDIYHHPENKSFRLKRPNPNVIHVGDVIFVPTSGGGATAKGPPPPPPLPQQKIYELQVKGKTYVGTQAELDKVVDAVIAILKDKPLKLAKFKLEQARLQYEIYDDLAKSDRFVTWVLDALTFDDLTPSRAALSEAEETLKKVELALQGRFILKIESELRRLETKANLAIKLYRDAVTKLGGKAGQVVTGLEITKFTSFLVVGACATVLTGGGATGVMASTGAKLGMPALLAVVEASADEAGKALADDKNQTKGKAAQNILVAGATSLLVGKLFNTPQAKKLIGKSAYWLTSKGKFTADKLNVVVKQKTMKEILESYLGNTGSNVFQEAIKKGVDLKLDKLTMDELQQDLFKNQVGSGGGTFVEHFLKWGVKVGHFTLK